MAQIYNPNAAATFNKLIQSGLSTADAAQQAGITPDVAAQYALGNNNNLGSLTPGVDATPATAQSTFATQAIPQTGSGQPAQGVQLASAANPVFNGVVNQDGTVTFFTPGQNQTLSTAPPLPNNTVTNVDVTGQPPVPATTDRPATTEPFTVVVTGTGINQSAAEDARLARAPGPVFSTPGAAQLGQGGTAPTAEPFTVEVTGLPFVPKPGELGSTVTSPEPFTVEVTGLPFIPAANPMSQDPMQLAANQQAADKFNTTQQAAIQSTYKQPGNGDWRFRISLAEGADYLYKAAGSADDDLGFYGPGILAPLATTNGVVFPYTPQVSTSYQAKYNTYDLIHSNYRGVFYQNSSVSEITVRGTFTAQDTSEGAYLLAVIHFFRSVTKMFYGQDSQRGAPPPLVYLTGLGDYQFNQHPAVVTSFEYSLPNDVDYIRANNPNNFGTDLGNRRAGALSPPSNPLAARVIRMLTSKLNPGAEPASRLQPPITNSVTNTAKATYVPTKIDINISLLPVQTRDQVSKQFSLKDFATGSLLRGGFW